ncbi:hypothetical protein V866_008580 [Kwoniella sp. B9012]
MSNAYACNSRATVLSDVPKAESVITTALDQAQRIKPLFGKSSICVTEAVLSYAVYSTLSTIEDQIKSMNSELDKEPADHDVIEFRRKIDNVKTVKNLDRKGKRFEKSRIEEISNSPEYQQFIHPPVNIGNSIGHDTHLVFYPESSVLREGSDLLDARRPPPSYVPEDIIRKLSFVSKSLQSKYQFMTTERRFGYFHLEDFERWELQARRPSPVSWFDWK